MITFPERKDGLKVIQAWCFPKYRINTGLSIDLWICRLDGEDGLCDSFARAKVLDNQSICWCVENEILSLDYYNRDIQEKVKTSEPDYPENKVVKVYKNISRFRNLGI
jgi:hypothetical protein